MIEQILRSSSLTSTNKNGKPLQSLTNTLLNVSSTTTTSKHKERRMWECEICRKSFDRPSLLTRHIRTHTGKINNYILKSIKVLFIGEKPHECDICSKAFSTSSSLNTHRRIHSGEKPHICDICNKRFTASSNLYYHKLTHSKVKNIRYFKVKENMFYVN